MKHHAFPKIRSFRHAEEFALAKGFIDPIRYVGSVKLHGTNAGICLPVEGRPYAQSRRRTITPDDDNAGFAAWVDSIADQLPRPTEEDHWIYGEWVGPGIMKKAAITQIPEKRFFMFGNYVESKGWGRMTSSFAVELAKAAEDIDGFNFIYSLEPDYQTVQFGGGIPEAIEAKRDEVVECCPGGELFGVEGPGEGLVYIPIDPILRQTTELWFKVKGDQHHPKAKAPKPPKKSNKAAFEFARKATTLERREQGVEFLRESGLPVARESTGDFIKWVQGDILDELSVEIEEAHLDPGDVARAVGKIAAPWFLKEVG